MMNNVSKQANINYRIASNLFNETQLVLNTLVEQNRLLSKDDILDKTGNIIDSVIYRIQDLLDWESYDSEEFDSFEYIFDCLIYNQATFTEMENGFLIK